MLFRSPFLLSPPSHLPSSALPSTLLPLTLLLMELSPPLSRIGWSLRERPVAQGSHGLNLEQIEKLLLNAKERADGPMLWSISSSGTNAHAFPLVSQGNLKI